jgi:hypothetical protein
MKKQRDEAIKWVNKRVNHNHIKTLAINASFSEISSFITKDSLNEAYTIKALS